MLLRQPTLRDVKRIGGGRIPLRAHFQALPRVVPSMRAASVTGISGSSLGFSLLSTSRHLVELRGDARVALDTSIRKSAINYPNSSLVNFPVCCWELIL